MEPAAGEIRIDSSTEKRVRVVIVAAGFAGSWAAREMAQFNVEILLLAGDAPRSFRYKDCSTMVTIGRNAGVAHLYRWNLTDFPAWVVWLCVHLYHLIGFRSRIFVLLDWRWDYFFYERAVRLILAREPQQIR